MRVILGGVAAKAAHTEHKGAEEIADYLKRQASCVYAGCRA
jgi:hypothetical protein